MSESAHESEFQAALLRASQGSEEDVRLLIKKYGHVIQRVVRRRLDMRLRSKFDSLDFVQMVWASFFRDREDVARFQTADELIRYLVSMARNKVIDEERRRITGIKYNTTREQPLAEDDPPAADGTPSQIAIARESYQLMTESDRDREILRLRMSGVSYEAISRQVGVHERTVRKIIGRILGSQAG